MKYYNTTKEDLPEQMFRLGRNVHQAELILKFFQANPGEKFTPFEVLHQSKINAPIWSVRRAMTDLTHRGNLIKTTTKKLGPMGANNLTWELVKDGPPLPGTKKTPPAEAFKQIIEEVLEVLKKDSAGSPSLVSSDYLAKKYHAEIRRIITTHNYGDLIKLT